MEPGLPWSAVLLALALVPEQEQEQEAEAEVQRPLQALASSSYFP